MNVINVYIYIYISEGNIHSWSFKSSNGEFHRLHFILHSNHVHLFDKQTMQWDILTTGRVIQKSIADRRREQKLKTKLDVS